jgi:hypothetical protein
MDSAIFGHIVADLVTRFGYIAVFLLIFFECAALRCQASSLWFPPRSLLAQHTSWKLATLSLPRPRYSGAILASGLAAAMASRCCIAMAPTFT